MPDSAICVDSGADTKWDRVVGKVFPSHRRRGAHALAVVGLAERPAHHFGPDRVFIDTGSTPGGRFPDELDAEPAAGDVVIAAVHEGWAAEFAVGRRGTGCRTSCRRRCAPGRR